MSGNTSAASPALLTLTAQQQLVLHLQPVADGVGVLVQPGGNIHTAGRGVGRTSKQRQEAPIHTLTASRQLHARSSSFLLRVR